MRADFDPVEILIGIIGLIITIPFLLAIITIRVVYGRQNAAKILGVQI
tara:strand:- start:387 stop:530 length:144 start_codon:yes stop_codon:yes gene_type:complete